MPFARKAIQMDFIFHADDFGITPEQSRRILECCDGCPGGRGLLNSLSVLAGSPRFEECASLLDGRPEGLRVGVHLNFVEGPCCADPVDVPLLVDEKGMFKLGYGGLLAGSWGARSAELRRQLTVEAGAQIARVVGRFPELAGHLRVDGHQHTQLIPAVFDATLEAVRRSGCTLEYLRIPAEPTRAYLRSGVAGTVTNLRHRMVDLHVGLIVGASAAATAPAGRLVATLVSPSVGAILFNIFLLSIIASTILKMRKKSRSQG